MKKSFWLMVAVFVFWSGFAYSQATRLDSLLAMIANKYQLAGMSVAVIKDSQVVFSRGYGLRDIARNLPVDENTKFRIASISKMVTATAIMQLYEQGLFRLDDDVSPYLGFQLKNPKFPDQSITFKMLLSHTSSLRDGSNYNRFLNDTYAKTPVPALQELLVPGGSYYSADMFDATRAPAQSYFQYSNINFGILGTLVEKISGERFDRYCIQHIFNPLGMAASFNVRDLPDINDVAVLYRKSGSTWTPQADHYNGVVPPERDLSGYVIGDNGAIFAPQGGLRTSARDLAKFLLVHLQGGRHQQTRLLNDTTTALMHQSVWRFTGGNGDTYYGIFKNYALGNSTTSDLLPGQQLIGHPGEAYGLISDLYFSTFGNYGIIFITNGGVWGNGTYSGWYNVEEEVFKACYGQLNQLTEVVSVRSALINGYELQPNCPNPFNSATHIRFRLPHTSVVSLEIFDISGKQVALLLHRLLPAGGHTIRWDAGQLASGIYLCRLQAGQFVAARKITLLR
ncbi:MAG: serine hydrolase [candidate division KSB1 bacterium]|nr:serine hydrolase [candidate division KSB1 bacterium]MDZ7318820.1 serine hydrolase [candidate division KSB1 bacterium]MDZ7342349.1 serine hydrolase [candidate division KSB1 bacterium]